MRFLVDRCVGPNLAKWLHDAWHDVFEARNFGTDPGDRPLLELPFIKLGYGYH